MEKGRLPKEFMKWSPQGRRKRGRPKLTWAEGIRGLMGEKGLMEEDWNDKDKWGVNPVALQPYRALTDRAAAAGQRS